MHRFSRLFVTFLLLISGFAAVFSVAASQVGAATQTGTLQTYIVLYQQSGVPSDAAKTIAQAGGSLVYSYDAIGVAIARSDNSAFTANLLKDKRVDSAAATTNFGTRLNDDAVTDSSGDQSGDLTNAPANDSDNLSGLQWDMRQIKAPQAHTITGGSPQVVVGDIDTGLDYRHPDLAANVDFANSVSCVSGVPNTDPAAWDDHNGHGTHTAGTIAAASNGIGIVGVAPNVKIAGIKAGNDAGYFFPEAVVCAFMWAGSHHLDVTSNSYFADPYLFNCHNDPTQQAIWKAEQRAIRYAMGQGVTVVAAEGNQADDLAHPTQDVTSPDNTTPVTRDVTNACVVIPAEIAGVIGVTADGNTQQANGGYLKSFYSSYGVGSADVVAPGGDSVFGKTAEAPNGRVLSTWPDTIPCSRKVIDPGAAGAVYCYLQGTSMATPHVAGVAALIISQFGNLQNPQNGKMSPGQVQAYISQTADPQACPTALPAGYDSFVATDNGAPQQCQGGPGNNGWYGNGQVDALNAVTHSTGNQ